MVKTELMRFAILCLYIPSKAIDVKRMRSEMQDVVREMGDARRADPPRQTGRRRLVLRSDGVDFVGFSDRTSSR